MPFECVCMCSILFFLFVLVMLTRLRWWTLADEFDYLSPSISKCLRLTFYSKRVWTYVPLARACSFYFHFLLHFYVQVQFCNKKWNPWQKSTFQPFSTFAFTLLESYTDSVLVIVICFDFFHIVWIAFGIVAVNRAEQAEENHQ